MSLASVVAATRPAASTPGGPTIDNSSFDGGRCRTCRQHPRGGPPSMSSPSEVAATEPAASTPRGPAINISSFGGGRYRTCRQHPQGARHRRLQLWWWPLSGLPIATPRGPTIDVFNIGGGCCWTCHQHPLGGPAIDVSSFGGGRCRTCHQHPPGGQPSTSSTSVVAAAENPNSNPQGIHHQRLQLRWWPLPKILIAPPKGPAVDVCLNLVPAARIFLETPTWGAHDKHYHYKQGNITEK
jgi:hypothetical protein